MSLLKTKTLALAAIILLCLPLLGNAEESTPFFPFVVSYEAPENAANMAKYLHTPAGKHGFIRTEGERFVHNEGEIRFWGTNLSGASNFPFCLLG